MTTLKKTIIALLAITLLLAAALSFWLFWEGSTKEMVSVADELQVPQSWKLESENMTGSSLSCISDTPCPHLDRSWSTNEQITKDQLREILDVSDWNMNITDDCLPEENNFASATCEANGKISGYKVTVSVINFPDNRNNRLILAIKE